MELYQTNNPVPSNDPRDLDDNAKIADRTVTGTEKVVYDRLGQPRFTLQALHSLVVDAKDEVGPIVDQAKKDVNAARTDTLDTASKAKSEMEKTAAELGSDLNNKRYSSYAEMVADPQTREAVVAVVDGDPDSNLNAWYSWNNTTKKWVRFSDQPVRDSQAKRLFVALDPRRIPGMAWGVDDGTDSFPLFLTSDGVSVIEQIRTTLLQLGGGSIKFSALPGAPFVIQDALGNTPFFLRSDGVTRASALDADMLSIGGVDLSEKLNASSVARSSDLVMSDKGLIPAYPMMPKVSGWGSSSLDYLGPKIQAMLKSVAPYTTYFNGAKAGETSRDTSGRLGSVPMLITVPSGSIPAGAGQIQVTCSNVAKNSMLRPFTGTLAGVYGTMSSDGTNFYFNRKEAGSAASVNPGTPLIPDVGPTYRDGVALLWMGKNDLPGTDTVADIAKRTDLSFDYFIPYVKRILVFGHFANPSWKDGPLVDRVLQINALHAARYSSNYVDTLSYLESSQVWADTGITPTADDLSAQQGHCLAPSLTDDGVHFNEKLNVAFTEFVKQKIKKLGWF